MNTRNLSLLAAFAVIFAGTIYAGVHTKDPYRTIPNNSVQPIQPRGISCDLSLQQHVYHPDRLKVLNPCMTVTGTIEAEKPEPDGDYHIRLKLDAGQEKLLNAKNVSGQHGDLVIEPVCQHSVTQADAVSACQGFQSSLVIPAVGTHVSVTGPYVLDQTHGWTEIHPITSIKH